MLYRDRILKLIKHSSLHLLCFIVLFCKLSTGQCNYPVTHFTGSKIINCINVTVNSMGLVDTNSTYCSSTAPYFVGYNTSGGNSGNGSFTFLFSPPVSSLTLNFSGISNVPPVSEEIHLKVNGTHYSIPTIGNANGCDAIAILTSSGDIAGCLGCSVSGWNGTTIMGPINSLEVMDTVIFGDFSGPAGALFSLFICGGYFDTTISHLTNVTYCKDIGLTLNATTPAATYLWQDNSTSSSFKIDQPGTYWVNINVNNCSKTDTFIVKADDCDPSIPNVFTPNEDGQNDAWEFTLKGATNLTYAIYNRWGNLIYQPERKGNTTVLWDGRTSSGEKCSEGVYYYVLEYTDGKGDVQRKKGYISLFR